MCVLRGLAAAALLAPAILVATGQAEAGQIDYCVGGPINVGYAYTGSIVSCTVPYTGTYRLRAYGADGGDHPESTYNRQTFGGKGTAITVSFSLMAGDALMMLVGGRGRTVPGNSNFTPDFGGGGGGGTFVQISRGGGGWRPLLVAGGGGGAGSVSNGSSGRGLDNDPNIPSGDGQYSGGAGGAGGGGGGGDVNYAGGSGGGGLFSDGGSSPSASGGMGFLDGGGPGRPTGSCLGAWGGFGGGGASGWTPCGDPDAAQADGGGGGGGYSGGGGGGWGEMGGGAGGGGSSFYSLDFAVTSPIVTPGGNIFGDGQFQIQWLTNADGTPVPEPGSLALLATALAILAHRRARPRRFHATPSSDVGVRA